MTDAEKAKVKSADMDNFQYIVMHRCYVNNTGRIDDRIFQEDRDKASDMTKLCAAVLAINRDTQDAVFMTGYYTEANIERMFSGFDAVFLVGHDDFIIKKEVMQLNDDNSLVEPPHTIEIKFKGEHGVGHVMFSHNSTRYFVKTAKETLTNIDRNNDCIRDYIQSHQKENEKWHN